MAWECERVYIGSRCVYVPKSLKLIFDPDVWHVVKYIDEKIHSEFLIYLSARRVGDGVYHIHDWYIPEQEVTYASVDVKEVDIAHKYNAVLHKHPSRSQNFSPIDNNHININHELSLLLSDGKIVKATLRINVPCGKTLLVEYEPKVEIGFLRDDVKRKVDELISRKIRERTYVQYPQTYSTCPYKGKYDTCPIKNYYRCNFYDDRCPYKYSNYMNNMYRYWEYLDYEY